MKRLKYDTYYMDIALITSQLSADRKIKVGSVLVRGGQILSQGFNGQPAGMANRTRDDDGVTLETVIHSEANALMKLAKNGGQADGATCYCSHSPCFNCALLLLQAGVRRIVYQEIYDKRAIEFLQERGIEVECITGSGGLSYNEVRCHEH